MKKNILLLFILVVSNSLSAQTFVKDGISYAITTDSTVKIVPPCTYIDSMIIPSNVQINEIVYKVNSIGSSTFYNCTVLKWISIPNSVDTIEAQAFYGSGLRTLIMSDSIKYIGDAAFARCTKLANITLPPSLKSIGYGVFGRCYGLQSIVLPDSLQSIGDYAFYQDDNLTSITLPATLKSIDDYAFWNCSKLTSIILPENVTTIGSYAFSGSGLNVIDLSDSLNSIESYAFSRCLGLTSIQLPDSLKYIGDLAFDGCYNLTSIILPDKLNSIGELVFDRCISLNTVVLPNSLSTLPYGTFYSCTGLTTVTLPDSLEQIGNNAFWNCLNLSSIEFPSTLTSIGDEAFSGCEALTKINIKAETPPVINNTVFYHVNKTIPLIVPAGSIDAYKTAAGWNEFSNIINDLATFTNNKGASASFGITANKVIISNIEGCSIVIYDISGKVVDERNNSGMTEEFIIDNSGVYIISIDGYRKKIRIN